MYEQRPPIEHDVQDVRSWRPEALDEAGVVVQDAEPLPRTLLQRERQQPDQYVVVDELDEGNCRLTIDPWPGRDGAGRLKFASMETQVLTVGVTDFKSAVDHHRRQYLGEADDAAERDIRIGDTFAVYLFPHRRPAPADPDDPSDAPDHPFQAVWREEFESEPLRIVDVTAEARQITHAAAEAAATGTLTESEARDLGIETEDNRQEPPRDTLEPGPDDQPPL